MIGFYNYTVILTYVGLISSVLGIFMSLEDRPVSAVICLIVAGICDMFDGKVARTMERTKEEKRFGIQIDSLCDLVGFGVLPVAIGYSITKYSPLSAFVYSTYILAAVIRLAYYNVTEEVRQETEVGDREYYQGLPVTTITIVVPLLFIMRNNIGEHFAGTYLVVIFFIAIAFVSNFKLKKHPLTSEDGLIARFHGGKWR